MTEKKNQSRLFRGKPNQVLLDERVSRIVLPTLDDNRDILEDQDAFLQEEDESSAEETQVLQIFVGSTDTEVSPESTWELDDEDDDPFSMREFDSSEESDSEPEAIAINMFQSGTVAIEEEKEDLSPLGAFYKGMPLQPIIEIDEQADVVESNTADEWDQIQWDEVTLQDILGEDFQDEFDFDADSADDYGMKLDFLESDIPEPLHLNIGFFEEIDETKDDESVLSEESSEENSVIAIEVPSAEDVADEWNDEDEVTASWSAEDTAWMTRTPAQNEVIVEEKLSLREQRELADKRAWKVFAWVTTGVLLLGALMWMLLH